MTKSVWITTIQEILEGNTEFCNTQIIPLLELIPAAKHFSVDADTKRVLIVISSDGEHAEINRNTDALDFFPNAKSLEWSGPCFHGTQELVWKCEASSVAYFSELHHKNEDNKSQLSAVAFSPLACPYTFHNKQGTLDLISCYLGQV